MEEKIKIKENEKHDSTHDRAEHARRPPRTDYCAVDLLSSNQRTTIVSRTPISCWSSVETSHSVHSFRDTVIGFMCESACKLHVWPL